MVTIILGLALPWLLVGIGCCLLFRLVRQQGGILERLKSLDQKLSRMGGVSQRNQMKHHLTQFAHDVQRSQAPPPSGLTAGTAAPDFALPALAGEARKLQDFRGRKVLLIFFNADCGYCVQMSPDLAALPVDGSRGHPVPVLIASGAADTMRQLAGEHNLGCPILLDAKKEVGALYRMTGTPTGYLIDEHGVLASALAVGATELLALAEAAADAPGPTQAKGKVNRGLAASRINRDGLKAGTAAPGFRLPKVGGGELALEELRGQRVLLVFSDPECGPCNALAPRLDQLRQRTPAVQLVMISRRDEEANKKKAAELGLRFPVVLQQQWEISRQYGIFETPVGYLIDESGVIVRDVARGGEAIFALLSAPVPAVVERAGAA